MEGAFYYVYETINFTKGKYYIGQHCTLDVNDGYFGSSSELKTDIKNGDEYEVNVIAQYKNIYDLGHAEYVLIKERNCVKDEDYYNKANHLWFNSHFEHGLLDVTKKKIQITLTGRSFTKERCDNISKSLKGIPKSKEHKLNMKQLRTKEHKLNMKQLRTKEHKLNISEGIKKWWDNRKKNNNKD